MHNIQYSHTSHTHTHTHTHSHTSIHTITFTFTVSYTYIYSAISMNERYLPSNLQSNVCSSNEKKISVSRKKESKNFQV